MARKKIFHLVLAMGLVLSVVSFLTFPVSVIGAQKELLIGVSLPLSGPHASYGVPEKLAQQIAVDQINKQGGVPVGSDRYRLKLIVEDNKYLTKDGVAVVNKLVRDNGVRFIYVFGTAPALGTVDFMNKNRIINCVLTSDKETISPKYPYTFRVYNTSYEMMPPFFSWIRKNMPHIKVIHSVMMDDATGKAIGNALLSSAKYFDIDFTPDYVPRTITDFYPVLTNVIAKKPDAIFSIGATNFALVYKSAREMGFKGQFLANTFKPEWWQIAGADNLEGCLHCEPSLTSQALPQGIRDYRNIYFEKQKEEPSGLSMYGFIWVHVLAAALQQAGTISDPDKIKNVLETQTLETMAGRYVFGGESFYGQPHQVINPGYITKLTGGKEVTVAIIPSEQVSDLMKKVYK